MTLDEYVRIDEASEWKYAFIDGEVREMPHVSVGHAVIAGNVLAQFHTQLRDRPCYAFIGRLRVAVERHRHYTYPDIVVACDPIQLADEIRDTITNPVLIVEVLSGSDENHERYRSIPTLTAYMLVTQDRVHVELYTRQSTGEWVLREWDDRAAEIHIESLRCSVNVAEVYAKANPAN